MSALDTVASLLILVGLGFFICGAIALSRLPGAVNRVHALTKVDTLGLGFVVLGLVLRAGDPWLALKLLLVWLFVLASGSTACYLVVHSARSANLGAGPAANRAAPPSNAGGAG